MSVFRDFFAVKQKPVFTGLKFGFGSGGGGADEPVGVSVSYLVIAGGGGGGRGRGGGGGAGGYRTNYASETPGGENSAGTEAAFSIELSTNYPVQIGAGGVAGPGMDKRGFQGGPSIFSTITSVGGAGGGAAYQPISFTTEPGTYEGGCGGGGAGQVTTPATNKGRGSLNVSPTSSPPHIVQGYRGGHAPDTNVNGAGGGGAGATGGDGGGTAGGNGKSSSITGSAVTRAGGGGGGGDDSNGPGGTGGGGDGKQGGESAGHGTHATGGGGGGSIFNQAAGRGGTGIIILRYPNAYTIANPGGGLTLSTSTTGSDKVTQITHPSPTATVPDGNATGNVSWS